jgi:hypothetical protein
MQNNCWSIRLEEIAVAPDSLEKELIAPLPQELIEELGWKVGDEIDFKIEGKLIILSNLSKSE